MGQSVIVTPKNPLNNPIDWSRNFWKFSRPHTIIGTSLSVFALFTIAGGNLDYIPAVLITLVACLCGNVYIVGLNQLEDIDIDKINKPDLPLASGAFTLSMARAIVLITGIIALILAFIGGYILLATVGFSLLLGTVYSLPPIRLKRFPLAAAFCILTVRGIIVNLGIYSHFQEVVTGKTGITPEIILLTLFIFIFTVAIAIFKDVPDMEGDRQYRITTFTLLLGKERILTIVLLTISLCYAGMIGAGLLGIGAMNRAILIIGHSLLLILLWWRGRGIDLDNKSEIVSFYQFIWKLFFLEYLIFPLACIA